MSLFEQFSRPAPVDVAGTAYQERSPLWELIAGAPQGPQVRDPARMRNDPFVWGGGGTAARSSDLAWEDALASPTQRAVAGVMSSEPMSKLMMLANFMGPKAPMPKPGIRAYHGSPHDFDRFDLSKIGTGEGAQAYGHGLYFAEAENVAKSYRDALGNYADSVKWKGPQPPNELQQAILKQLAGADASGQMMTLDKLKREAIQTRRAAADYDDEGNMIPGTGPNAKEFARQTALIEELQRSAGLIDIKPPGRMYEVNIKADPSQFLDYDVPISQQPQARAAVEQAGFLPYTVVDQAGKRLDLSRGMSKADAEAYAAAKGGRAVPKDDFDFDALQKAYRGKDAEIAAALNKAGIPGVKYKDAGSRDGAGGTNNLVVFDDSLVEIIRKYGLAGLLAGGASLATPSQGDAAP